MVASSPFENLQSLWAEEDRLVQWAKAQIEAEPYLIDHLDLIETYMDCVEAVRKRLPKGERFVALGGLFLRTFDSMGHAVRAAMSGNYTGCVMYCRDLVETGFLLNYLTDDDARPAAWLNSDIETARKEYKPVTVRMALDKRDGFAEKKREEHYKRLSVLGSHPTPQAFAVKRDGTRKLNSGPFKHRELLEECVQEIAIAALLLAGILVDFCNETTHGSKVSSRLSLVLQRTREKYFGKP
jgi:hypothetical protein